MQIIPQFNPGDTVSYPSGQGVINIGAADSGSKMLLYNKSPYDLQLDFYNGNQSIAHAKQARVWTLDGDTKQIGWTIPSSQNVISPAQSIVQGELYNAYETIEGTYPVNLDIQTDASNKLTNVKAGTFDVSHKDFASGAKGTVFLTPTASQWAYITGFCVSAAPGAAALALNLAISGINAASNPDFWVESTTTQGCFEMVVFPTPHPANNQGEQIGLQLLTNANAATSIVIFGYYV